jgi:tryptophan synthase alpha subunit
MRVAHRHCLILEHQKKEKDCTLVKKTKNDEKHLFIVLFFFYNFVRKRKEKELLQLCKKRKNM